jgi:hypothetical protein
MFTALEPFCADFMAVMVPGEMYLAVSDVLHARAAGKQLEITEALQSLLETFRTKADEQWEEQDSSEFINILLTQIRDECRLGNLQDPVSNFFNDQIPSVCTK